VALVPCVEDDDATGIVRSNAIVGGLTVEDTPPVEVGDPS
jgi:hypothetical protein